ncbi:MAG: Eco57I restriction-modification methylase domain-containing protein, partial [Phormidesmis sp.]
ESIIESYLFLGLELKGEQYSRTKLSVITRELNKLFAMPVMVIFRYGELMTLAVIDRRLNKRDESKDVLEKVTLIRDISVVSPHRAHTEILFDLSLEQLYRNHKFNSFEQLHRAWRKTLNSSELNKRFFKELTNWYFWATEIATFPENAPKDSEKKRNSEEKKDSPSVIRMITRLMFVWFLKEKGLVPDELFRQQDVRALIHFDTAGEYNEKSSYYKAILQNLFFATLNQEMNTERKRDNRKFRSQSGSRSSHYGISNVFRYEGLFRQPKQALALFDTVPFLNGGLFECLDDVGVKPAKRVDGFSDRADNALSVPNELFFAEEHEEDLSAAYETESKKYKKQKVRGLIDILGSYKFTISENTPLEEDIALDPELLGKVFENLLASYNAETKSTARKKTGSFYTPREVVDYMVDESLKLYLLNKMTADTATQADSDAVEGDDVEGSALEDKLNNLLNYQAAAHEFDDAQVTVLIDAIDQLKMIDPAVGSGAFPMGILQKLVFLLSKLDPKNERWYGVQLATAERIEDSEAREAAIEGIQEAFERNELDYGRKLYLIEKCVYGVDIQPIAVQIAKLRFFISLIVDQRVDDEDDNRGIRPLPNLETKFVAANTLLSIEDESGGNLTLKSPEIEQKEDELKQVRRSHFSARTQKTKKKYREIDKALREEIGKLLIGLMLPGETARKMSHWDPYDQNTFASFFNSEWMFGVQDGFDVVIGNPPYVRHEKIKEMKPDLKILYESAYTGVADLYVYFYAQGLNLLREGGILSFISSNKYFRARYGEKLRKLLTKEVTIHQIIDFGDAPVFTAIAYPTIVIAQKAKPEDQRVMALNWEMGEPIEQFASVVKKESFWMPQQDLNVKGWQLADDDSLKLLKRLRKMGTPVGEYVNGRFYRGVLTGLNV